MPMVCLSLILLFTSCIDDMGIKNKPQDEESGTLTIYIPNIEAAAEYGATRNDEYRNTRATFDAEEGKINKLWLLAYPDGSSQNEAETKITQLTLSENKLETSYKEATVSGFKKGKYHIYLVANLEDYLENNTTLSNINEDDLLSLILKFSTNNFLEKGNLPMACLNTEVKTSDNIPVQEGVFEIKETGNTLYADLTFLCAKVRYTILYDATDFSKNFESSDPDFSDASVENVIPQTPIVSPIGETTFTGDPFSINAELNKARYPEDNSPYFNIANAQEAPESLNPITTFDQNASQRAWQGIVYLPENITSEENEGNRTKVSVNSANGKTEMKTSYSFSTRNLERGKVYDMVAKLSSGEVEELETKVRIEDWTLKTLSYILHGQFELVVEATKMNIRSGYYSTLGYYTDSHLSFDFPTINYEGKEIPFYVAQLIIEELKDEEGNPIKDEDGNPYVFNDEFDTHFRITINPDIPFVVLFDLQHETDPKYTNGGTGGYTNKDNITYTSKDVNSFHVVAGNLHKQIEVDFDLSAFLIVTPKVITINTREYYTSGTEYNTIPISFRTNYNNHRNGVDFKLTGPASLFTGMGEMEENGYFDLILELCSDIDEDSSDSTEKTYLIGVSEGVLNLRVNNIFKGHEFWNEEQTYTITFTLNVVDPHTGNLFKTLEPQTVTIIIKPFTTNYTIHFKDNTKSWEAPHIFVYQDLTLPSDLGRGKGSDNVERDNSSFAGMIVGYIENNTTYGPQWNAATEYVFSNNVSFRGWYGYGGPECNNPWDKPTRQVSNPNADDFTMGFVMFGERTGNTWNFDYSYQPENSYRSNRYRFDVDFNEDHGKHVDNWGCPYCQYLFKHSTYDINDDINSNDKPYEFIGYDSRFYPGIAMERDEKNPGWWKYTLTGVAQPGKTMMFFVNWHKPWEAVNNKKDYATFDNRYPGDYEAGLQLFDFEDNEGWFLFDGNTANRNQFFSDEKPSNELSNVFTPEIASNMRIEFEKPDNLFAVQIFDRDDNWTLLETYLSNQIKYLNDLSYIEVNSNNIIGKESIRVKLYVTDWNDDGFIYELAPKNFIKNEITYITNEPLRQKFAVGTKLHIVWSDNINLGDGCSYHPLSGGCDYINVFWDSFNDNNWGGTEKYKEVVGNYKFAKLTLGEPYNVNLVHLGQKLVLKLSTKFNNDYYKYADQDCVYLNITDLPKYYNPSDGYYHLNYHMLDTSLSFTW